MINTVLGKISKEKLGHTRIHEHILWAWTDNVRIKFDRKTVVSIILPHLKELKSIGCDTLVEATPNGAGRDVSVLKELSEKANLNIITNCGVWDGLDYNGAYIPQSIRKKSSHEIAEEWIDEYEKGIDKSGIKPGIIKIGLGDNDVISDFQRVFLKAAIITSKYSGLPILSHICSSKSAIEIVEIVESENLELDKIIWSHADFAFDDITIIELAKRGIWIELSWHTGQAEEYNWYIKTINRMRDLDLLDQLLVSQDAGGFHEGKIVSYRDFYTRFIQECVKNNISNEVVDRLLISNPSNALDN
ncbi:MAG: hypothetical protein JSV84_03325 [Gemmatimonadota bacterium]|nr:MAG: hypothetical protein JSV84_03325 [Gemmatimonadota bacterium]